MAVQIRKGIAQLRLKEVKAAQYTLLGKSCIACFSLIGFIDPSRAYLLELLHFWGGQW